MNPNIITALLLLLAATKLHAQPIFIEAESFKSQTLTEKRQWHIFSAQSSPQISPDGDPAHLAGASGGSYIEVLPDTRRSHADKLIKGENFTEDRGTMAVLIYKVTFPAAGRYYVWVRAYTTTSEDNGLHFGLNGKWPESGARWQTVQKNGWNWDCKQRTEKVHTGVPMQLWLDVEKAGEQELLMSMREDGIEVDQIALTTDVKWRPDGYKETAAAAPGDDAALAPLLNTRPRNYPKTALMLPRQPDGDGTATVSGELKQWHKVTLTFDGPFVYDRDMEPNPFTDVRLNVTFTHESGAPRYVVPGYFAADGNAADSGADSGTKWRAHLSPDKPGRWTWEAQMLRGKYVALGLAGEKSVEPVATVDGKRGEFTIAASDITGRDFRAQGRLQYVGKHHLQFAGSKQYFLKAGPDAPETLLAYADFDNTIAGKSDKVPLKTWQPHVGDWKTGDPTWREGRGKGLIGALNYLSDKGVNAFSFLTYNAEGDGDNVWPFVERDAKLHYDCSKLDQWGVVFDHATARGLYLHFKLQENEMDDDRRGMESKPGRVPESLDGGKLGIERKLYCRELIARFGHALALNWNIGEENTQSSDEVRDMVKFLHDTDPYRHHIVLHTFPPEQEKVYAPLLGEKSLLTGVSLQNSWKAAHQRTLHWLRASAAAGRPWVVAQDEQNPASLGVPPDPGYRGHSGIAEEKVPPRGKEAEGFTASSAYTLHDIRKLTLWGTLMAGGAGVEYYFGYQLPENDLVCEDFRSRDKSWDYCRLALDFFRDEKIPFGEMQNANALIGNTKDNNSKFCLAKPGEIYLVYLPNGGTTTLDLTAAEGEFSVDWFNPRVGGALADGSLKTVEGGKLAALGDPPADAQEDWLIVVRQ